MGTTPSIPSGSQPAPKRDIAPYLEKRRINAGEEYGTFAQRVAELNKIGTKAVPCEGKEKGSCDAASKFYDDQGDFVGGIFTKRTKDGKYSGGVTIGKVTYHTDDITGLGKIDKIYDSRGASATDRNKDGTVNPSELTIVAPPFDNVYHSRSGEVILDGSEKPKAELYSYKRSRIYPANLPDKPVTTQADNKTKAE